MNAKTERENERKEERKQITEKGRKVRTAASILRQREGEGREKRGRKGRERETEGTQERRFVGVKAEVHREGFVMGQRTNLTL